MSQEKQKPLRKAPIKIDPHGSFDSGSDTEPHDDLEPIQEDERKADAPVVSLKRKASLQGGSVPFFALNPLELAGQGATEVEGSRPLKCVRSYAFRGARRGLDGDVQPEQKNDLNAEAQQPASGASPPR